MRGSLHAHILCWFEKRQRPRNYAKLGAVPRRIPGTDNRQRPKSQEVGELSKYQEDNLYHAAKVGRVVTEMARPDVSLPSVDRRRYGGWDYARMRIAGLLRAIQTKMALHCCSTKYCLQNRSTCRFFFPTAAGSIRAASDVFSLCHTERRSIGVFSCRQQVAQDATPAV